MAESVIDDIVGRLPEGTLSVCASTQYEMGFILTNNNEIVFRDDRLSHRARSVLADEVNERLGGG
jgi:hypothetical protein